MTTPRCSPLYFYLRYFIKANASHWDLLLLPIGLKRNKNIMFKFHSFIPFMYFLFTFTVRVVEIPEGYYSILFTHFLIHLHFFVIIMYL